MKYYLDSMLSTNINTNHVESSLNDLSGQRDFKKPDDFSNIQLFDREQIKELSGKENQIWKHETSVDHMEKYTKSLPPLENAKQQQHLPITP